MTEQTQSGFVGHLIELRNRLMKALLAILLFFIAFVYFANDIYSFVAAPLVAHLPSTATMIATDVTAPFFAPFKLTLFVALFAAIPVILHQIWGFIAPGLYKHEKRMLMPILASSILLFYSGIAFCYFVVLPIILGFFYQCGSTNDDFSSGYKQLFKLCFKAIFCLWCRIRNTCSNHVAMLEWRYYHSKLKRKAPLYCGRCFRGGYVFNPTRRTLTNIISISDATVI